MRVVIYGEVLNVRRLLNQLYYLCCFYYPYVEVLFSAINKSASAKPFFNAISRWSVLEQLKCVCFALKSLVRIALSTDFFILILVDTSNACWYLWFLLNHWDFNICMINICHCKYQQRSNKNDYVTHIYNRYADLDGNNRTCSPEWEELIECFNVIRILQIFPYQQIFSDHS